VPDTAERMIELVERCEKATGPDDPLEWDIAKATGWRNKTWCPDYTRSLDAAMTLNPGWVVRGLHEDTSYWWCELISAQCPDVARGNSKTAALALCAAALRARAHSKRSDGDGG
jgi:hypothetical protein